MKVKLDENLPESLLPMLGALGQTRRRSLRTHGAKPVIFLGPPPFMSARVARPSVTTISDA
jgi:hypothetical protein